MSTATSTSTAKALKARVSSEQRQKRAQRAAILLKQTSDPTRLLILVFLTEGEKHVGALCDDLNLGQPAVSHHLALLRHGGLVYPERRGKNNFYTLTDSGAALAKLVKPLVV